MRGLIRGLDEMALEVTFIAVAAVVGIVALRIALNSGWALRASSVPLVGAGVTGLRSLFNAA